MIADLTRAPFEAARAGLFYLRNKQEADVFIEAMQSCDACQARGICPEHLEVAQEVFFNDD